MEVAAMVGAIIGAYVAILGCYVFTFTLWANLSHRLQEQLSAVEKSLHETIDSRNEKIDDIAKCVAKLEGRHEAEDRDSDVRRL